MEKEKVVARLHQRIDNASRKIDELKLQTHLAKADAKVAFDERIESLENQRNKLRDDVHHLQHLTSNAWVDLAEGCKNSWNELKSSLRKAVSEFQS
jgi:predicted  nucleic acid-binding Zn-ribbon protein